MNNQNMTELNINDYKTGFVTIIARPNVGKSTLLNKIAGQKIAITTPVAQTTRKKIQSVYTDNEAQIIFIDTPGIHKPKNKLGEFLETESKDAILNSDVILFLVDYKDKAGAGDNFIVKNYLSNINVPIIIAANKIDYKIDKIKEEVNLATYKTLFNKNYPIVKISAKTGKNVDILINEIKKVLPVSPPLYPEETITDQSIRTIVQEIIREKIILNTKEEIPHSVAVLVDNYNSEDEIDKIKATIFVASSSQKGIIIGRGGSMLKKIGTEARCEIEDMVEKKVFLELFVKVKKNWQKDKNALKMLGYCQ